MPDIKIEAPPTEVKLETTTNTPADIQVDKSPSSEVLDLDEITHDNPPPKEKTESTDKVVEEASSQNTDKIQEAAPEKVDEVQDNQLRPEPQKRDFSVFEDEDKEIAKLAPNRTYNLLKERLPKLYEFKKQATELKGEIEKLKAQLDGKYIPESWAEHPEAYTLTDDYRELNSQYARIDLEAKHWRDQMLAIKRGEQWRALTGFDKDGNPIYSNPIDPTPEHEVAISGAMADTNLAKQEVVQKANAIRDTFKNVHAQATGVVKQYLLKVIEGLPAEAKPEKTDIDTFIKAVPPQLRANVMTEVAANLFSMYKKQSIELKKLKSAANTKAAISADAKIAGPKVQKVSTGKVSTKDDVIDFNKLQEEMNS